jgi:exonuclease III
MQERKQMSSIRIATWNVKSIAPRQPLNARREWIEEIINPDIIVLTEAKAQEKASGPWNGWSSLYRQGGINSKRPWGTVLASSRYQLKQITTVKKKFSKYELDSHFPGTLVAADVYEGRECWGTVVGMYGLTVDRNGDSNGSGRYSVPRLMNDLDAILKSGRKRVVVAGDLNLHPQNVTHLFAEIGLIDLIHYTSEDRENLKDCMGCGVGRECGHLWTHKNGNADGNGKAQQLDYIFASKDLLDEVDVVAGGIQDFPDAWSLSDHAPVVVDFVR